MFYSYILAISFFALSILPLSAMNTSDNNFILKKQGNIPILLTAPHGGTLEVPNCPLRTQGTIIADRNTLYLTELISEAMGKNTEQLRPYIVGLTCARKYVDVNRPVCNAYEHDQAAAIYDSYHAQIEAYIKEITAHFTTTCALLLDIHGHADDPNTIFRGTQDTETVQPLLTNCGYDALTGSESILGKLHTHGYTIHPPLSDITQKEHSAYNGGFTLSKYGSHATHGINALQLELGCNLRKFDRLKETAHAIALAVIAFHTQYQK